MINSKSRVVVTGGSGMVGVEVCRQLKEKYPELPILALSSKHIDLKKDEEASAAIVGFSPTMVIHLAAKVGGVKANMENQLDFLEENLKINSNVLEAANQAGAACISLLSTCIYPDKNIVFPLTEAQLHNGPPHESNYGYAYAKRMLEIQTRAYNETSNAGFRCLIPNNLYGKFDNFEEGNSHVIPALIRRVHEAKLQRKPFVEIWGSGSSLREFTFSVDLAKIIILFVEQHESINTFEPFNVGSVENISIRNLAQLIKEFLHYDGELVFDSTKPEGQFQKPTSNLLFQQTFGRFPYTSIRDGLRIVCEWYTETFANNKSALRLGKKNEQT